MNNCQILFETSHVNYDPSLCIRNHDNIIASIQTERGGYMFNTMVVISDPILHMPNMIYKMGQCEGRLYKVWHDNKFNSNIWGLDQLDIVDQWSNRICPRYISRFVSIWYLTRYIFGLVSIWYLTRYIFRFVSIWYPTRDIFRFVSIWYLTRYKFDLVSIWYPLDIYLVWSVYDTP